MKQYFDEYIKPALDIILFTYEDIIRTSPIDDGGIDPDEGWGPIHWF